MLSSHVYIYELLYELLLLSFLEVVVVYLSCHWVEGGDLHLSFYCCLFGRAVTCIVTLSFLGWQ